MLTAARSDPQLVGPLHCKRAGHWKLSVDVFLPASVLNTLLSISLSVLNKQDKMNLELTRKPDVCCVASGSLIKGFLSVEKGKKADGSCYCLFCHFESNFNINNFKTSGELLFSLHAVLFVFCARPFIKE